LIRRVARSKPGTGTHGEQRRTTAKRAEEKVPQGGDLRVLVQRERKGKEGSEGEEKKKRGYRVQVHKKHPHHPQVTGELKETKTARKT